MNRAIVNLFLVSGVALTGAAQVAQGPGSGAVAERAVPGTAPGAAAATQAPAGSVTGLNLGTGDLIGANGAPTASPQPVRPPSLAGSSVTPIQFQNINRIALELNALATPIRDVPAQQRALLETLQAAPIGKVKPPNEMVTRLGNSLTQVLPTLNLTAAQRRQLAIDLNLALNSGSLSGPEAERVMADARSLLQGSTVHNTSGVEQIMGELASIVGNQQASAAQQSNSSSPDLTAPTQTGQAGGSQTGHGAGTSTKSTHLDNSTKQ